MGEGESDREGVEVLVESSWTVLKGSLESCVSVVFLDPDTHEPILSSSPNSSTKLVLIPPAEPVPCEITVKFQGRLCHVQSLYSSSSARICEIYSRSNLETDPEYVCTVKGWIPCKDDFSSDNGTEKKLEDAATKRGDGVLVKGLNCSSDSVEKGLISSGVSLMPVSNHDVDDECQKSVYSSGDDSWVNVKLNESLSAESACASLMAPDLDNWHVPLNVEELVHLEDQLGMASLGLEAEKSRLENADKLSDRSCEGKAPIEQVGQGSTCQETFEAEVELVDHNPWAAITIRLLSLQDKSVVEVDQMVFLAISGPVPEPAASICQSDGREPTSPLFAMFLPSILQMARGVSDNSKNLLTSEKPSQAREQKQEMMGASLAGEKEDCKASHQSAILEGVPTSCPPSVHNIVKSASSKTNSPTKLEGDQSRLLDGNISRRTMEPGDQTLPMCNGKDFVGDVIKKELATTFEAFSERFDRLELLCLRLESFLHKTFECLDQRIRNLEAQHTHNSGERDSKSKHLGTPSDVSIVQSHQNDYPGASKSNEEAVSALPESAVQGHSAMQHQNNIQTRVSASLLDQTESEGEVSSTLMEPDHSEIDAAHVNDVDFSSADIKNLVKERPSDIQESSTEPEVMVVNTASKDKLPHVSLDDAWASALSAFASSIPSVHCATENNVTSSVDKKFLGSAHHDDSVLRSQYSEESKGEGNGSSPSSHLDVTVLTNDVYNKAVNTDNGPIAHGVCDEATCHEQMSAAQERWGNLPANHSMTSDNLVAAAAFNDLSSTPDQRITAEIEFVDRVVSVEGQGMLLPSLPGALEPDDLFLLKGLQSTQDDLYVPLSKVCSQQESSPNYLQFDVFSPAHSKSMLVAETLDDWGTLGALKIPLSPVFLSSLEVNQDVTSSHPDITVLTNCVDNKAINTGDGPTHGVCEEATCHEHISEAQLGWGSLSASDVMTSKPISAFDEFLAAVAFNDLRSTPDQKTGEIESVDRAAGQGILLPGYPGAPEPVDASDLLLLKGVQSTPDDLCVALSHALSQQEAQPRSLQFDVFSSAHSKSMLVAETLDDWGTHGGLKTWLSPVFQSSSEVNQDVTFSHPNVKVLTNDVDNKVVNMGNGPTHAVCEEATCHEQMSAAHVGWGSLPASHSMTSKPILAFDDLLAAAAFNNLRSTPDQKLTAEIDLLDRVVSVEGQGILLPSHLGVPAPVNASDLLLLQGVHSTPDDQYVSSSEVRSQEAALQQYLQFDVFSSAHSRSMRVAETLDDWETHGGPKTQLLPLFPSSSEVNQDAAPKLPACLCDASGDNEETGCLNISGGIGEYDGCPYRTGSNIHDMWQIFSSYANSGSLHAERSEEENLCNRPLKFDFLSGHVSSERGGGSSIAVVQDHESIRRSFVSCTTEETSSFPDPLDDSSSDGDGRTCSEDDSLCFSQDFEGCPKNESSDTWSRAPNIFYVHDPESTDDEADNTVGDLDESNDSILQGVLSDTDSTQDFPFWSGLHSVSEEEQPTMAAFPGFENLC